MLRIEQSLGEASPGTRRMPPPRPAHLASHCSTLLATALLLVLLLGSASSAAEEPEQGYLIPIVRGFANNQIVGLKEVLALGQVLGRTVIVTGLIESPDEQQSGTNPRVIPFDYVFDRQGLERLQAVTYLPELRRGGWNGSLDLVTFFSGQGSDELWLRRWAAAFNVSTFPAPHMEMKGFHCSPDWLARVKHQFKGHKFVGVSSFEGIVGVHPRHPGSEWRFEGEDTQTRCHQAYMEVTRVLDKSAHLQELADRFILQHMERQPFVALHVRPYPDTCLKLWERRVIDRQQADRKNICVHPANRYQLDLILGPAMKVAMQTLGASKLFVMADPRIRYSVDRILKGSGLEPLYLSLGTVVEEGAGPGAGEEGEGAAPVVVGKKKKRKESWGPPREWELALEAHGGVISLLGMVEEEVAARSSIFFATTGYSSMAGMVIQQRQAHGSPKDSTITFDMLGTLDPDVWPEPWSAAVDEAGEDTEGEERRR